MRALLQLAPSEATLLVFHHGDGGGDGHGGGGSSGAEAEERCVDARLLWRGDLVVVKGGERLPCDGTLERDWSGGRAAVDEAMLTGEAMPVAKRPGDAVLGGTVNRSSAPLWIRATNTG